MIDNIITYLAETNTVTSAEFKQVEHAWTMEPVIEEIDDKPALFVFPGDDTANQDNTDNLVSNMVVQNVHFFLICDLTDYDRLIAILRTAMIGYSAGSSYTDLEMISSRTMAIKGGVIWREEVYFNEILIRAAYT